MKIDVELCGQLLVMRRREQHLEGVVACLGTLTSRLSQINAYLREDYESHQPELTSAESRVKIIAEIEGARDKTYTMLQDTHALSYEAAQFHMPGLWHSVASQRQKVFEMRSRVFDTGRRAPGAAAKFNRVLWTLDGQETHVDWSGRTEEEIMEEHGLNDMQLLEEEEEEEREEREEREREAAPKPPPSWLLKMIASWGNRWGSRKKADDTGTKSPPIVAGDRGTTSPELTHTHDDQ
jgi:squalene cyclase